MTDEKDGKDEWVMPAPIFRTTEGHRPARDEAADVPTEPGFRDDETVEMIESDDPAAAEVSAAQSVREKPLQRTAEKSGWAGSFFALISILIAAGIAIILAIAYFLFYYRGTDRTF